MSEDRSTNHSPSLFQNSNSMEKGIDDKRIASITD